MIRSLTIIAIIALAAACASAPATTHVANPDTAFNDYRSFSWIADEPRLSERPEYSARNDDRIEYAIISALQSKGYRFIADRDAADFVIGYSVGVRNNLKATAAPEYFGANWSHASQYIPPDGRRDPAGELGLPDEFWKGVHKDYGATLEKGRPKGTLTIDIFDVRTKTPAWQGVVQKEITQHDRENADEAFNAAIAKLFEPFPSRATR